MTHEDNPIIAELRKTRESLLARYNSDMNAMVADLRRRTEEERQAGRRVVSLPPRRPKGWSESTKKSPQNSLRHSIITRLLVHPSLHVILSL
jgi:hypothetical protein